jgi:hypothetical protein
VIIAAQTNPFHSMPDYVDIQEMAWTQFSGTQRSVSHQTAFEDSANLDFTHLFDNGGSANTFCSPAMLEPCMRNNDLDAVDHPDLTPSLIQRLASLDVAIFECGLKLPFPINTGNDSAATGTRKSTLFALDELFRLTTEFLEIFTSLSHVAGHANISPGSILPESDTGSTLQLHRNIQNPSETFHSVGMEEPAQPFLPLDEATMFMVISCHCRLTEFYAFIFDKMQACIEHSLVPRRDKYWAIILPQVQVGSIASPSVQVDIDTPVSSATSSMYMLMITMLSSKLWGQLADEMRVGGGISLRMGSTSVLTETVWDNVTDKNNRMLQTIDNTKLLLQRNCVAV